MKLCWDHIRFISFIVLVFWRLLVISCTVYCNKTTLFQWSQSKLLPFCVGNQTNINIILKDKTEVIIVTSLTNKSIHITCLVILITVQNSASPISVQDGRLLEVYLRINYSSGGLLRHSDKTGGTSTQVYTQPNKLFTSGSLIYTVFDDRDSHVTAWFRLPQDRPTVRHQPVNVFVYVLTLTLFT